MLLVPSGSPYLQRSELNLHHRQPEKHFSFCFDVVHVVWRSERCAYDPAQSPFFSNLDKNEREDEDDADDEEEL